MNNATTFLDTIVARLTQAAQYNQRDAIAPSAVFWPDQDRAWKPLIPRLRERLPILTLGPYAPEEFSGPAAWLRCVVARTIPSPLEPGQVPIIYFPGVAGKELRNIEHSTSDLRRLADLRYRSVVWTQPKGQDWTVAAFLQDASEGVGVEVRQETAVGEALRQSLIRLADVTVGQLKADAPWRAADFRALMGKGSPASSADVASLIASGESKDLEFKSTARWNIKANRLDKEMEREIIKTVGAFLNKDGGTLLIGVEDDGNVIGLEPDYQTFPKNQRNPDKYELTVRRIVEDAYGREFGHFIDISFHPVQECLVCKLTVLPAPRPAYATEGNDETFYVRMGNSSPKLSIREAVEYIKMRWD